MDILDVSNLTLNAEEATDVSKAIFEHIIEGSDIEKHHDIHTGIQWDTQIPFIGAMGMVGKELTGCKPTANGNKIPISEKTWAPKLIGDRFEHCAVDASPLLKLFKKLKRINPDFYDRIDSDELGIVFMRIEEAVKRMLPRIIWFGDTNAKTIANGGVFKNGTDLKAYNMLDGLWKQIISKDITNTSKYYVNIRQNAEADYGKQGNLPEGFAFDLFKQMWSKADVRLKQLIQSGSLQPVIHCTSAIAENWKEFKEKKSLGFTISNVENGGLKEMFRNMTIETHYDWDTTIQSDQDNGTKYNLPNRALLTEKGNIPIGTVSTDDLDKLTSFYDNYNQVNVIDFSMKLDVKFLQPYLAVAAY